MLFLLLPAIAFSQFYPTQYRPSDLNWQQLKTIHFRIVFPQGEDSVAWRTARILENEYSEVQTLTDGSLSDFPVILNNYNDRSNGFITPIHFRSEIEVPPIKGKSLNPQTGSWLENVAPHELVHALHFSNTGGLGLGGLVNLFSPDMARAFHGAIPAGITEGLATYHETAFVAPDGGRGNYPFFYNQFNAIFTSPERWSMGQMGHFPERTRPFNRHYMGGYEFTAWLQDAYGDDISRDALNFYIDLPFLGYGVALKHATGKWPAQLYNEFTLAKEKKLKNKEQEIPSLTELSIPFSGRSIRQPNWLDSTTLIFYGSFYNERAGFFRYDLNTDTIRRITTTNSVEDYVYNLSEDKSSLIYSSYRSSPIYDNTFKAELVEVDLATGESNRLTTNGRLYAPSYRDDMVLALQTDHASSKLVTFNRENESIEGIVDFGKHRIIEVSVNPVNLEQWAVVVNKRGMQALWMVEAESIKEDLQAPPEISFAEGSVFDPSWHPDGEKLLLSSDHTGAMNIYEYNLQQETLRQITSSEYNALEASYSPHGNRIALILQKGNEQLPAVISNDNFYNRSINPSLWKPSETKNEFMKRPELGHDIKPGAQDWKQSSYSSGLSWLKPRTVIPIFEEIGNTDTYEFGASLHSSNLLQNQSYSLDLTGFEDRFWYDLSYRNKSFFPGFKASAYNKPSIRTLGFVSEQEQDTLVVPLVRQERSLALSVPLNVVVDRNIYFSSFFVEPEIRRSEIRYLDTGSGGAVTNFAGVTIGNIFASFNYKLQQNIRDIQPNTGFTLFGEAEHFFSGGSLNFNVSGRQRTSSFSEPTGLRGGVFTYVSPLRRWNQSLRIGLLGVTQTGGVFDNQFLVSDGFSEPVFPTSDNLLGFSTRYTIPLFFADDGGFLLPFYLSNIYMVGFTNTVADASSGDPFGSNRTVFGGGIRMQFRLSNLSFDVGVGIGYEPTGNKANIFVGNF